jgi:hypothetical protein
MEYKIPKKLGTIKQLIDRFEVAKARKAPWIDHLRECYEYTLPQRETFNSYSAGQRKNRDIFDSTAVIGVQSFASRMQATMVPPWRRWSILSPGSEIAEEFKEEAQTLLDATTKVIFDHINHSNFATQTHEAFLDLAISTGAMTIERSKKPGAASILEFNAVPLAEIYPEEGPNSSIETVWREREVAARNIEREWEGANVSSETQKLITSKPNAKITIIEGCVYEPEADMYYTCIIEKKQKHIIYTEEMEVSPWIIFREMVVPGETLGRGRVMQLLPDIKTLNKVNEFTLRNAALAISGVYTAQDDGVINPYTMTLEPGAVIPVGSNDNSNPTLKPLDRSGDFNVGELISSEYRERINKGLFAEPFGGMESPTKTATEMSLRGQELVMSAGSAFSRLQTEFVEKVIRRVVHILSKEGKIDDVKVDGRLVTIKHTSPLARAQDQEDLLSMQQFMEMGGAFGPEMFGLGAKLEDIVAWTGHKLGIEQKLLRTAAERAVMQEQAADMMNAQQAQAAGQQPQQPQQGPQI